MNLNITERQMLIKYREKTSHTVMVGGFSLSPFRPPFKYNISLIRKVVQKIFQPPSLLLGINHGAYSQEKNNVVCIVPNKTNHILTLLSGDEM